MRYGFGSHRPVLLGFLALIKRANTLVVPGGVMRRLDKRPRQIFIPVLAVAFAFFGEVGKSPAAHTTRIRSKLPHLGKALDCSGLIHDRHPENLSDAVNRQEFL